MAKIRLLSSHADVPEIIAAWLATKSRFIPITP
jgi:hypothetical protein